MSWSFKSIGRPRAVLAAAHKQLEAIKCTEPEETLKAAVLAQLDASLGAMPEASAVQVEAFGSQSPVYDFNAPKVDGVTPVSGIANSLTLKIEPIYGFVE